MGNSLKDVQISRFKKQQQQQQHILDLSSKDAL